MSNYHVLLLLLGVCMASPLFYMVAYILWKLTHVYIFGGVIHKWKYDRNPYRRECVICGRREESYCLDMESWNNSWWESEFDGDPTKHGDKYKEMTR